MKILVIGGTGNISWHCTHAAKRAGHEVWILNRGISAQLRHPLPPGVAPVRADIRDPLSVRAALGDARFDVVADFLCQTPEHANQDIELFAGRTGHFLFISSTAVYQKPTGLLPMTESTPLHNPYWNYAQNKIACEAVFMDAHRDKQFPVTIVRPAHTYDTIIPEAVGNSDWTVSRRMLAGKPIVLHGDGSTLWTLTHAEDFARAFVALLGNPATVGQAFHITGDEWLTWRQISETVAAALGAPPPRYVCVPSDRIFQLHPRLGAGLLGHKAWCDIYDNAKIKAFAPGWRAEIPFREGIRRTLDWFLGVPERRRVDPGLDAFLDGLVAGSAVKPG